MANADDINSLGKSINSIKKNTDISFSANKEVSLEVNCEITK
jgi:hypothetical protein